MENGHPLSIGKIAKIDPREIWKYEARHFTPWLAKNIDYLSDVLNMDIAVQTVEGNVGPYFVDIYGEDSSGNKIIKIGQVCKQQKDCA